MSTESPILMYHAAPPPRAHSLYDAFFSGVLLAGILHAFAVLVGLVVAHGLELLTGMEMKGVSSVLISLPLLAMFLLSIFVFLREQWLGFLVGAALAVGAGVAWVLLQTR